MKYFKLFFLPYLKRNTHGIWNQFNRFIVAPPWIITVIITISEVVVSIACLCSDRVFRIANAKDIAPLRPKRIEEFIAEYTSNSQ